jgi:hypothetical protein
VIREEAEIITVTLNDVGDHGLWSVEIEPQPEMRPVAGTDRHS